MLTQSDVVHFDVKNFHDVVTDVDGRQKQNSFQFHDYSTMEMRLSRDNIHVQGEPFSLVDSAALRVTSNLNLTLSAIRVVPHHLFPVLLTASIHANLVVATKAILAAWPFTRLSFKNLQNFTPLSEVMQNRLQDEPILVLARVLADQRDSKICDIDITSLRTQSITESTFLLIILAGRRRQTRDGSHNRPLNIHMNLHQTDDCLVRNYVFLQMILKNANIQIHCKQMVAKSCGELLLQAVLVNLTDKEALTSLDIGFNDLGNSGLEQILHHVRDFHALTTLSMQYNSIGRSSGDQLSRLASTLMELSSLAHLKLGGNRLTEKLASLLGRLKRPLTGLDVSACKLGRADLTYLSRSIHSSTLQELDLSNNECGKHWDVVEMLLSKAANSLVELDLEGTSLCWGNSNIAHRLAQIASSLRCLKSLKIQNNGLTAADQVDVVMAYARCPSMQELHLSLPDIAEQELEDDVVLVEDNCLEWFVDRCSEKLLGVGSGCGVRADAMKVVIFDSSQSVNYEII